MAGSGHSSLSVGASGQVARMPNVETALSSQPAFISDNSAPRSILIVSQKYLRSGPAKVAYGTLADEFGFAILP
jgi:hypothetical protein